MTTNFVGTSRSVSSSGGEEIVDSHITSDACAWNANRYVYPNHWFPGTHSHVVPLVSPQSISYFRHLGRRGSIFLRQVVWSVALVYSILIIMRKLFLEPPDCI